MTGNLRDAIRAAFDAGCEQGNDEATAHEWGSSPQRERDDAFADFMAEWNPDSAPIRALIAATTEGGSR